MPLIPALITFVDGTAALAAEVDANFASIRDTVNGFAELTDVDAVITAARTYQGAVVMTGGLHLSGATPNLIVDGTITATGGVTGNAATATKLLTARTIAIAGNVTGSTSFDGSGNVSITASIAAGVVVDAMVAAGAAIAYTKLSLTGAIVNADISTSAAIAYAKLSLTGAIVNADISTSAAIADSKLATIATAAKVSNSATTATSANTASAIVARDASGNFTAGTITATQVTINGVAYTWPAADGTSGQTLQTNGSKVLSWAAAASGFVTGSGTTGTLAKFTGSAAVGNSIFSEAAAVGTVTGTLVVTGASISVGTNPATAGAIRLPAGQSNITGRDNANTTNLAIVRTTALNQLFLGDGNWAHVYLGLAGMQFPDGLGTTGQVLTTDGTAVMSWSNPPGVSGLTTNVLPKAASATTLTNSNLSDSGSAVTVAVPLSVGGNLTFSANGFSIGTGSIAPQSINLNSNGATAGVYVDSARVLTRRQTGWTTSTSAVSPDRGATLSISFNSTAFTNLVQTVYALLIDLGLTGSGHGLIGA